MSYTSFWTFISNYLLECVSPSPLSPSPTHTHKHYLLVCLIFIFIPPSLSTPFTSLITYPFSSPHTPLLYIHIYSPSLLLSVSIPISLSLPSLSYIFHSHYLCLSLPFISISLFFSIPYSLFLFPLHILSFYLLSTPHPTKPHLSLTLKLLFFLYVEIITYQIIIYLN